MILNRTLRSKFLRNQRAAAAVEFGLVLFPLSIAVLGGFDIAYGAYMRSVMQGTLADVARKTSVESPQLSGTSTEMKALVKENLERRIDALAANATYTLEMKNYYQFSGIGKPEKLTTDHNGNGEYDEDDADCFEDLNENGTYDVSAGRDGKGGASDIIFYELNVEMPRLMPMAGLLGWSDKYSFTVKTVYKNQPFVGQTVPPIECGIAP
jgi:Flp pilus assembly pilin Flp